MKVVILGLGNTGADICDALIGHASSIYASHNNGAVVVCRALRPSAVMSIGLLTVERHRVRSTGSL